MKKGLWTIACAWLAACAAGAAEYGGSEYGFEDAHGYTPLFNGRNLDGWTMQWPGLWTVEDGVLTGRQDPATGGDSWLFTNAEWDDFALELRFNMTAECNGGAGIRMPAGVEGRPSQYGYEIQISDIDEEYPTGSVFRHVAANQKLHKPGWNEMGIICVKDHIVVYLNRQKVVDARLEGSKKGRVGLQVHGGEKFKDQVVRFRDIRIKDLKPQYESAPSPIEFEKHQLDDLVVEGLEVVDIDRDGILDIASGPNWYEGPDWTPHKYREVTFPGEFANDFGEIGIDINRDGWMDIITGGWFTPLLTWYENPGGSGSGELWKEHVVSDDLDGTEAILPCDLDLDGRVDVLINRYNRNAAVGGYIYKGPGESETGFESIILGPHGRGHGMGVGDVNADGRDDVLTNSGWYECPPNPATQEWPFHGNYTTHEEPGVPMQVEDFNLDGLPDIIYGHGHDFGLFWLEQTRDSAGRQAWIYHTIDDTYSQLHCVILADMDRDGTKDVITGKRYRGHSGADPGANEPLCVFWYKVTKGPDPQFAKHIASYDENVGVGADLTVHDIDTDGDLDIISAGKSGLYILENKSR